MLLSLTWWKAFNIWCLIKKWMDFWCAGSSSTFYELNAPRTLVDFHTVCVLICLYSRTCAHTYTMTCTREPSIKCQRASNWQMLNCQRALKISVVKEGCNYASVLREIILGVGQLCIKDSVCFFTWRMQSKVKRGLGIEGAKEEWMAIRYNKFALVTMVTYLISYKEYLLACGYLEKITGQ